MDPQPYPFFIDEKQNKVEPDRTKDRITGIGDSDTGFQWLVGSSLWNVEKEEDLLSFMEPFEFPDLDQLKASLSKSKVYTKKHIDELVAGFKTLPEYQDNS